jgi:hypothetical protein
MTAAAVPPALTSVGVDDRHPVANLAAPRAEDVTIYVASDPARATDGRFLEENIEEIDFLTESEIQAGHWMDESQLDPGTYWVMANAYPDFDRCWNWDAGGYDPACADGFSNVVELVVSKPTVSYAASARARFYSYVRPDLTLTLRARPLGERQTYKVCWRQMVGPKFRWRLVCRAGALNGFSWDEPETDTLYFSYNESRMARHTTFKWFVAGRQVASKRILTCRCD